MFHTCFHTIKSTQELLKIDSSILQKNEIFFNYPSWFHLFDWLIQFQVCHFAIMMPNTQTSLLSVHRLRPKSASCFNHVTSPLLIYRLSATIPLIVYLSLTYYSEVYQFETARTPCLTNRRLCIKI